MGKMIKHAWQPCRWRVNLRQLNLGLLLCISVALMSACHPPAPPQSLTNSPTASASPLTQEVYIWQRQWRPAHQLALEQSRESFQGLRVLALQAHPHPKEGLRWFDVAVNHSWLQQDPRPKIAVIRIDGKLTHINDAKVLEHIRQLVGRWQAEGTPLAGIEIDHDSPSSQLQVYHDFLRKLRSQLPAGLKLSITALPAWLTSPDFEPLMGQIDQLVLQIHSVSDPRLGLFDPVKGWQWVKQLSAKSTVPYFIALPTYGSALINTPSGTTVESETPLRLASHARDSAQELQADPVQLQQFVQQLGALTDEKLAGIIWFRLPLAGDKRIWPLRTLIAVAHQGALAADIQLTLSHQALNTAAPKPQMPTPTPTPIATAAHRVDLYKLVLINQGNIPGALPETLSLAGIACSEYDAQNGYRVQAREGELQWYLPPPSTVSPTSMLQPTSMSPPSTQPSMLAPDAQRVIGWARCASLQLQGIYAP
ncbi:MAG: DUF3142 domain-containing protein [Shewanella sp.]